MSSNSPSLSGVVWVAWERQLRNRSLASRLGVRLHEFDDIGGGLARYVRYSLRTLALLHRERPRVVFAPNPSLALSYLLLTLRPLYRFRFVSDAHFAGVEAADGARTLQALIDHCNRRANMVIVTNNGHAQRIRALGGRPFVCQDPLPEIPAEAQGLAVPRDKSVFFICSFDIDEPYDAVFEAARLLHDEGFRIAVSGNFRRVGINPELFPQIELLGFVSYKEYYARLCSSSVVLDLTEHDNCLVCGAYEAMAAERPLVLSGTPALQSYFDRGAVFTNHEPEAIASAIREAYVRREELELAARAWKVEAQDRMGEKMNELRTFCSGGPG